MSGYWTGIVAILSINVIFAYSIYVTAAAGQLNLGGAGFQAIGAYGTAYATTVLGMPLWLGFATAITFTAFVGFLIAFPVLRTRGVYMVLATYAFAQVVSGVALYTPALGGAMGMVVPDFVSVWPLIYCAIGVTVFVFFLMATRFGLAMRALHDDEQVSTIMGVNARAVQVACFTIGGAIAGLSGALYAHHFAFVEAQYFSPLLSIFVLLFVLIGGTQTAWGPLVGASFFTLVPELLRLGNSSWRLVFFGLIIVAMMIFRPEGMVTRTLVAKLSPRRWFGRKPRPSEATS